MNRKMTTGFYIPTKSFKSIPEHVAVMFEDDLTLVAVVGASRDDPENLAETYRLACQFAASDELLEVAQLADYIMSIPAIKDIDNQAIRDLATKARAAIAKARPDWTAEEILKREG